MFYAGSHAGNTPPAHTLQRARACFEDMSAIRAAPPRDRFGIGMIMKISEKIKKLVERYIVAPPFKTKYLLTITLIGAVHVYLVILFSYYRVIPLILFNIASVACYGYCIHTIKYGYKKDLAKTFFLTYLEIILHSFTATICIGWSFGFPQYIIGLIPFGYYICMSMIDSNKKYYIGTMMGVVAAFSFIACRILYLFVGPLYQMSVSPGAEAAIYIFNSICNFFLLFLVTMIFIIDMQAVTVKLHDQNILLDNMASTDPLTGLYNRRSMQPFLDHAVKSDDPFCLVMCDIDSFKKVNDTYGHDFGDIVIKDITEIIHREVGTHGYVCRWGGEEFLFLYNGKLDDTLPVAESIRQKIEKHVFTDQKTSINCTITMGIATYRPDTPVEKTIKHADDRLYYGKQNGKNRVVSAYDTA